MKHIGVFKPLELGIIQGLMHWTDDASKGWKTMREILKDTPNFKSQTSNFPKYVKSLINKNIVEESWRKRTDGLRKREHRTKIFRLTILVHTYVKINSAIVAYQTDYTLKELKKGKMTSKKKNAELYKLKKGCFTYGMPYDPDIKFNKVIKKKYSKLLKKYNL